MKLPEYCALTKTASNFSVNEQLLDYNIGKLHKSLTGCYVSKGSLEGVISIDFLVEDELLPYEISLEDFAAYLQSFLIVKGYPIDKVEAETSFHSIRNFCVTLYFNSEEKSEPDKVSPPLIYLKTELSNVEQHSPCVSIQYAEKKSLPVWNQMASEMKASEVSKSELKFSFKRQDLKFSLSVIYLTTYSARGSYLMCLDSHDTRNKFRISLEVSSSDHSTWYEALKNLLTYHKVRDAIQDHIDFPPEKPKTPVSDLPEVRMIKHLKFKTQGTIPTWEAEDFRWEKWEKFTREIGIPGMVSHDVFAMRFVFRGLPLYIHILETMEGLVLTMSPSSPDVKWFELSSNISLDDDWALIVKTMLGHKKVKKSVKKLKKAQKKLNN